MCEYKRCRAVSAECSSHVVYALHGGRGAGDGGRTIPLREVEAEGHGVPVILNPGADEKTRHLDSDRNSDISALSSRPITAYWKCSGEDRVTENDA